MIPPTRWLGFARLALCLAIAAALTSAASVGARPGDGERVFASVDRALCPFPLDVTLTSKDRGTAAFGLVFIGPATVTLRNATTGRRATLTNSGAYTVDAASGRISFRGHRLWFSASSDDVPFLSSDGAGSFGGPEFTLAEAGSRARVVDPCALVAPSRPLTRPRTTPAPWPLPAYALSQIAYARLIPLRGGLVRHDHVHLDVIVNGRKVLVPAGVGQAEPVDRGPCPPGPLFGDCATHHIFTAAVATSPLHTHSTSGLIHIEADRPGSFTLGEFFDEWGVRLSSSCIGGYCSGGGRELRAFINGREFAGDPRRIVLTNRQEIAVVFGIRRDIEAVPAAYTGGWPGAGCGGPGERSCLPATTG
jgi:hypothetical protein